MLLMSVDFRLLRLSRLECFLWRRVQNASGVDQAGVGVQLKTKAWKVESLDVEISLCGNWLVGEAAQY